MAHVNIKTRVVTSIEPPIDLPSIKTLPEYLIKKANEHSKIGKIFYAVNNFHLKNIFECNIFCTVHHTAILMNIKI